MAGRGVCPKRLPNCTAALLPTIGAPWPGGSRRTDTFRFDEKLFSLLSFTPFTSNSGVPESIVPTKLLAGGLYPKLLLHPKRSHCVHLPYRSNNASVWDLHPLSVGGASFARLGVMCYFFLWETLKQKLFTGSRNPCLKFKKIVPRLCSCFL